MRAFVTSYRTSGSPSLNSVESRNFSPKRNKSRGKNRKQNIAADKVEHPRLAQVRSFRSKHPAKVPDPQKVLLANSIKVGQQERFPTQFTKRQDRDPVPVLVLSRLLV